MRNETPSLMRATKLCPRCGPNVDHVALVSSEIDQGALEQATGRVLGLRIDGPCTEGYC